MKYVVYWGQFGTPVDIPYAYLVFTKATADSVGGSAG